MISYAPRRGSLSEGRQNARLVSCAACPSCSIRNNCNQKFIGASHGRDRRPFTLQQKGGVIEKINLGSLIEQAITRVEQNRIGEKPPVFVTLSPALTQVPWRDTALKQFLRFFLYESLLMGDAQKPVEITLRRRALLKDLTAFVGIQPSYWVQLRIAGRGLKISESVVEDLFAEVGYRCEEWIGMDGSNARLGIFGTIDVQSKIVLCLETSRRRLKCDLLLPVHDHQPAPCLVDSAA